MWFKVHLLGLMHAKESDERVKDTGEKRNHYNGFRLGTILLSISSLRVLTPI